jgi:TatA/E family protein of Tat protein translocase
MIAEIFGLDGIIILVVVVVVLFGGAAIPKFARNLGSARKEFEKGMRSGGKEGDAPAEGDAK